MQHLFEVAIPASPGHDHYLLAPTEVANAISRPKNGRAPGPDGVTPEDLMAGADAMVHWIYGISSPAWASERGSKHEYRHDTEEDQDLRCIGNYRPISLTNAILKVWEHLVLERITPIIVPTIGSYQAGFTRHRQMAEHTLALRILNEQSVANKHSFAAVSLDLRGAYDLVCRRTLLQILQIHGVEGDISRMFKYVFDDHVFYIKYSGHLSDRTDMNRGLMQGGVLSPLLFKVYLDAVIREASVEWTLCGLHGLTRSRLHSDVTSTGPRREPRLGDQIYPRTSPTLTISSF